MYWKATVLSFNPVRKGIKQKQRLILFAVWSSPFYGTIHVASSTHVIPDGTIHVVSIDSGIISRNCFVYKVIKHIRCYLSQYALLQVLQQFGPKLWIILELNLRHQLSDPSLYAPANFRSPLHLPFNVFVFFKGSINDAVNTSTGVSSQQFISQVHSHKSGKNNHRIMDEVYTSKLSPHAPRDQNWCNSCITRIDHFSSSPCGTKIHVNGEAEATHSHRLQECLPCLSVREVAQLRDRDAF